MTRDKINPFYSCLYFQKHRWNFPASSFWPIEKQFRECVQKKHLANKWSGCCHVHFGSFQLVRTRANSVVWKGTKTAKIATMYNFLPWSGPKQVNYQTFLVWIHPSTTWPSYQANHTVTKTKHKLCWSLIGQRKSSLPASLNLLHKIQQTH